MSTITIPQSQWFMEQDPPMRTCMINQPEQLNIKEAQTRQNLQSYIEPQSNNN